MTPDLFSSPKKENGSEAPATKKLCVEPDAGLSYADRAKLPSQSLRLLFARKAPPGRRCPLLAGALSCFT